MAQNFRGVIGSPCYDGTGKCTHETWRLTLQVHVFTHCLLRCLLSYMLFFLHYSTNVASLSLCNRTVDDHIVTRDLTQ